MTAVRPLGRSVGEDGGVSEDREPRPISYAEFGERFFVHAVTESRIVDALRSIAGEPIRFGPIGAGPGKLAKVSADGTVGVASAVEVPSDLVAFRLAIPVDLELSIAIGPDHSRYHADVEVGLHLTARAFHQLRVLIDVERPTSKDVTLDLKADGVRADLLGRVAGIDREIRRFIAKYVGREIDKPHIREARDIDVAARIDGAYGGAP
jgi:hypothetical protein